LRRHALNREWYVSIARRNPPVGFGAKRRCKFHWSTKAPQPTLRADDILAARGTSTMSRAPFSGAPVERREYDIVE
jgi:hypothetical protein